MTYLLRDMKITQNIHQQPALQKHTMNQHTMFLPAQVNLLCLFNLFIGHFVSMCLDCGVCEAKSEGLVRYPTTLAPVSGSVTVTTQCADNANSNWSEGAEMCQSSGVSK